MIRKAFARLVVLALMGASSCAPKSTLDNNDCAPACSPGYVCVQSACVVACNPACPSGQVCTAARVCAAPTDAATDAAADVDDASVDARDAATDARDAATDARDAATDARDAATDARDATTDAAPTDARDAPVLDAVTQTDGATVDARDAAVDATPPVDVTVIVDVVDVVDVVVAPDAPDVVVAPDAVVARDVVDAAAPSPASIGVFRPSDRSWTLDLNRNGTFDGCTVDRCLPAFSDGDLPVVGDWSGTGRTAIGTYRRSDLRFTLDANGNGVFDGCGVDRCISGFGTFGDTPLAGDWSGTGRAALGVFHPAERSFGLDANGNGVFDGCGVDRCVDGFAEPGASPIVGDWRGLGRAAAGFFRLGDQTWTLDANNNGVFDGCAVDRCVPRFGTAGDVPVTGDWSGTGRSAIGIFRPSTAGWVLDANENGLYDGCAVDRCADTFGRSGDIPVTGAW